MGKLIRTTLLLAGLGYLGWRYWSERNRPAAETWAAGTDRIG